MRSLKKPKKGKHRLIYLLIAAGLILAVLIGILRLSHEKKPLNTHAVVRTELLEYSPPASERKLMQTSGRKTDTLP